MEKITCPALPHHESSGMGAILEVQQVVKDMFLLGKLFA
jgi:hypothetical protein